MSTSKVGGNLQRDISDLESPESFVTVEEKDTGFSSKRNIDQEAEEPSTKKERSGKEKDNCFEMGLMIQQLTTVVRELEEHEFRNVTDTLGEDQTTKIDGVIANMICLHDIAQDIDNVS